METLKVLFVDDEPNILDSVQTIFEMKDIQVRCVGSGEEALDAIRDSGFDIIFTDMVMPGMNGLEFAGLAREQLPDAKIYLISGNFITPEIASAALQAGISRIFAKPVDLNDLLASLQLF